MDSRRRALIEHHLPLVEQVVLKVSANFPKFVDRSEFVSAGMMGLTEAALRYDFDREIPFAGYAIRRIKGAVLDVARSADWAPRSTRRLARSADDVTQELAGRLGRGPTDAELATELGITNAEMTRLRERVNNGVVRALDESFDSERFDGAERACDRTSCEPDEFLEDTELRGYLRSALESLPERHRVVVIGCYLENRSFEELAELLGVTPSRVSQLRADAVQMIREGITAQFAPRSSERPKGRVAIRQAQYASAIARHADWRSRLDAAAAGVATTVHGAGTLDATAGVAG